jgi:hypothetical protein
MFALGLGVSAGVVYAASLRILWMSERQPDDDNQSAMP